MNFNPLPEEQQHPELISRLQEMYQMLPEDREALLRIQARLSEATPTTQLQPPLHHSQGIEYNTSTEAFSPETVPTYARKSFNSTP